MFYKREGNDAVDEPFAVAFTIREIILRTANNAVEKFFLSRRSFLRYPPNPNPRYPKIAIRAFRKIRQRDEIRKFSYNEQIRNL